MEHLQALTLKLLDPQLPAYSLRPELLELTKLLANAQSNPLTFFENIAEGESRTANGLAVSPTMAAMCADDYVRTITFIRGAHAAITELRKALPRRPVRVLYVGCGPYAILAIPLMTIFAPEEVKFTLLDMHAVSIASAQSIATNLGVGESVHAYETLDAADYRFENDLLPDMFLLEIMQACLAKEPQVAITRHLLQQAPNAVLVPEQVRVEMILVDPSKEFDVTALEQNRQPVPRDRISLGTVFEVNKQTVAAWDVNQQIRLPAACVQMPNSLDSRYQAMLFTEIRCYADHILSDYNSGLTCPRTPTIVGAYGPSDTIQFHYELGASPKLVGNVVAQSN